MVEAPFGKWVEWAGRDEEKGFKCGSLLLTKAINGALQPKPEANKILPVAASKVYLDQSRVKRLKMPAEIHVYSCGCCTIVQDTCSYVTIASGFIFCGIHYFFTHYMSTERGRQLVWNGKTGRR